MPFNCLTDNDKELINSYINKFVLSYSENPTTCRCEDMSHILRLWDYAKKDHLFKLLGNKLIVEKQISFTKSPNELQDDIYEAFVENDIFKRFYNSSISISQVLQVFLYDVCKFLADIIFVINTNI